MQNLPFRGNGAIDHLNEMMRRELEHMTNQIMDCQADALAYLDFPHGHHVRLRTNNVQERANEKTKRRAKAGGVFPSAESMMCLVGSVPMDVNEERLEMGFIDASSLKGICRAEHDLGPVSDNVIEKVRTYVTAAIEERLGRAARCWCRMQPVPGDAPFARTGLSPHLPNGVVTPTIGTLPYHNARRMHSAPGCRPPAEFKHESA
jgi:hypothetical protein